MVKKLIKKVKEIKIKPLNLILFLFVLLMIFASYYISSTLQFETEIGQTESVTIPLINYEINLKESSLFLAAAIIGLVDGFNPCAMWVLIYLITAVSTLKDRRKMIFIVGTFVTTEAIMYFLILAGWLNLYEFIGFSKWILYLVGAFALWFGIKSINDYVKNGGNVTCEVGDVQSRKKMMLKIKDIVNSPITIASVFATIILAFVVNSIEFVCSAGLPAIFTQMLAIADISTMMKYFYIFVYDFFFMLDDFIIFALAFMAFQSNLMDKYSSFSKLIGGIIMVVIGIVLLFFPQLLL